MATNVETPAANPIPFGLLCYGVSVFILAGFLWGGLPSTSPVVGYALFTGGLGMFLAALAAYRAGSTFGATLLAGYGAFWASTALYFWLFAKPATLAGDLSWIVVPWAVFTGYMLVCSLRTNMQAVQLLLALLFVALVLVWLSTALHTPAVLMKIAAILAIVSAIDAWFESYREIMESLAPAAPTPAPTSRATPAPTG